MSPERDRKDGKRIPQKQKEETYERANARSGRNWARRNSSTIGNQHYERTVPAAKRTKVGKGKTLGDEGLHGGGAKTPALQVTSTEISYGPNGGKIFRR